MRIRPAAARPAGRLATAAVVLFLGVLLALPAAAQWKWRDAQGRITVSDRPPPRDVPERDILSRPQQLQAPPARTTAEAAPAEGGEPAASAPAVAPAPAAATAPPSALEREVQARRAAEERAKAEKARAEEQRVAERKADNCRRARGHLAALQSGQRMARTNAQGEREILDDAARAAEVRRANEVIAADCR